jgi:ABC-type Mn2+/Zn2+ transport system ATPase subunit
MTPGGAALRARDVTLILGGKRVLDGVSLEVLRGEFICLCGPNGGGKTTFLKVVLGLARPDSGSIEVLGSSPDHSPGRIGYLPQRKAFAQDFPASAAEVILANFRGAWPLRIGAKDRERAGAALARVGGEDLIDKPLRGLSGGETQRVFLARALVIEPELLLLDEPTAGVDARGRAEFLDLLAGVAAREDLTAVLVTHHLAAVRQLADKVAYLDGRLVAWGAPEEALAGLEHEAAFATHDHDHDRPRLCEED